MTNPYDRPTEYLGTPFYRPSHVNQDMSEPAPTPEKAAPIPADVLALAEATAKTAWKSYGKGDLKALIARAIMQGRADRASQEERIREDERDRLFERFRHDPEVNAYSLGLFVIEGAKEPSYRARLRGAASK